MASIRKKIPGIVVNQWLKEWDKIPFDPNTFKSKPSHEFFVFSIPANELKRLCGIYRRTTSGRRRGSDDLSIQRRHEENRSLEISKFVRFGFPWSELSERKRKSDDFANLQKPGWLPTAIVLNVLKPNDLRMGKKVDPKDLIGISKSGSSASLVYPEGFKSLDWRPKKIFPIEIIDGQHRLWAFEENKLNENYELPVVAFHGLDLGWQAYLFWTINIKPKKINASLAFDLYPLLRTADWIEKFEGHSIYRETRAQELTDALWGHSQSPWYQKINMLGEPGKRQTMASQAAWIRSLLVSYVKSYEGRSVKIGGLFGAPTGSHKLVLPWSMAQQSAFLISMGQVVKDRVSKCKETWAKSLRRDSLQLEDDAFYGRHSLLNHDQGIRGLLQVTNDLCYVLADELGLESWDLEEKQNEDVYQAITNAIKSLKKEKVFGYLEKIAVALVKYDWRTSAAPGLTEREEIEKKALRGSGGYKVIRTQLLKILAKSSGSVGKSAVQVLDDLGY